MIIYLNFHVKNHKIENIITKEHFCISVYHSFFLSILPLFIQPSKMMATLKLSILITFLAFVSAKKPYNSKSPQENRQKLTCYERYNHQGDSVVLSEYAPILDNYNFDNRASSCCFEGIWLLYDQEYYNTNNPNALAFQGWGENFCQDFDNGFTQVASSARYTGAPDGYKYVEIL